MDQPQTFRSPTALVVWVVWLLFAAGNWADLAVQGRDHASVVAAAVLLLATGVAYVTAQRPRVVVDDAGVTVVNPLRDHRIRWAAVASVDLADLLRVHCAWDQGQGERRKVISSWAVHYSRRRQFAAEARARRSAARIGGAGRASLLGGFSASRSMSYGTPAATSRTSTAEADAQLIVRLISDRATAARAQSIRPATLSDSTPPSPATPATPADAAPSASAAVDVPAPDSTAPLTSTWSNRALVALAVPALILLIVCLL